MPGFLKGLTTVGTAAMLWVGGSIVLHGLEELGFAAPAHLIHDIAAHLGAMVPQATGAVTWTATAAMDGVLGLALGLILIPVVTRVIAPLWSAITGKGRPA
jgi:predicted DNA repair protein MutK